MNQFQHLVVKLFWKIKGFNNYLKTDPFAGRTGVYNSPFDFFETGKFWESNFRLAPRPLPLSVAIWLKTKTFKIEKKSFKVRLVRLSFGSEIISWFKQCSSNNLLKQINFVIIKTKVLLIIVYKLKDFSSLELRNYVVNRMRDWKQF